MIVCTAGPELAIGDGALGFWKALREVYGGTREQRCWVHKSTNVLNQMPKTGTLRRLTELRQQILEPLIAEHHGRVVKLIGEAFARSWQRLWPQLERLRYAEP